MPSISIRYVEEGGRKIPLLTDAEKLRLAAQIEDLEARAARMAERNLVGDQVVVEEQVASLKRELAIDAEIEADPGVLVAEYAYEEPTVGHYDALREAGQRGTTLPTLRGLAFDQLAPHTSDGTPIPLAFRPILEDACYSALDPNPSEARRFFSIGRRRAP